MAGKKEPLKSPTPYKQHIANRREGNPVFCLNKGSKWLQAASTVSVCPAFLFSPSLKSIRFCLSWLSRERKREESIREYGGLIEFKKIQLRINGVPPATYIVHLSSSSLLHSSEGRDLFETTL